jgi:hypothetical protein
MVSHSAGPTLIAPQCIIAWYFGCIVLAWCNTITIPSNLLTAEQWFVSRVQRLRVHAHLLAESQSCRSTPCLFALAYDVFSSTQTWRSAANQVLHTYETLCPASPLFTEALFLCIVLTAVGMNWPTESGPSNTASLAARSVSCDAFRQR